MSVSAVTDGYDAVDSSYDLVGGVKVNEVTIPSSGPGSCSTTQQLTGCPPANADGYSYVFEYEISSDGELISSELIHEFEDGPCAPSPIVWHVENRTCVSEQERIGPDGVPHKVSVYVSESCHWYDCDEQPAAIAQGPSTEALPVVDLSGDGLLPLVIEGLMPGPSGF
ncbi:hypothetical protein [Engelhardtia mirabilis]|uniref:hypothetical protein n=1 Tax=Engelhardtia mirabilis TaxID=2528011 RepID=UPI0011A8EDC4